MLAESCLQVDTVNYVQMTLQSVYFVSHTSSTQLTSASASVIDSMSYVSLLSEISGNGVYFYSKNLQNYLALEYQA